MAPKVAVPIPPIVKAPNLSVRSPAPAVSAAATVIRFRGSEKSTLFSTQIRPAMAAIKPNSTIDKPPMTGPGIERIRAPKFWREAQQDRDDGSNDKQEGRIDLCRRHHTDVLGVSRHSGAAAEGGTIVARLSPKNARPKKRSRLLPVIAPMALMWPRFSATRMMATGAIKNMASAWKLGPVSQRPKRNFTPPPARREPALSCGLCATPRSPAALQRTRARTARRGRSRR